MGGVAIIGCGFVADLYMRSLALHPDINVVAVYDRDKSRQQAFCAYWSVNGVESREVLIDSVSEDGLILNLTNPDTHYEINKACLQAGRHVYCEKPLAMTFGEAQDLHRIAGEQRLILASAPCSVLGEAAQTLLREIRQGTAGEVRLVYAELDDGFIPQASYDKWLSESGVPWPAADEFGVGCTLEHAGYYLSWLIAAFGPVQRVVAASAEVIPDKPGSTGTPDFSVATLFFASGVVARLTCSIVAPHDQRIRVIGDKGVLEVQKAWHNDAPVRFCKRVTLRRRLLELPGRRRSIRGATHPKVSRKGAATMNFALGPADVLQALREGRAPRLDNEFALHMTEVTLAIQTAGDDTGPQDMTTSCTKPEPMTWAL